MTLDSARPRAGTKAGAASGPPMWRKLAAILNADVAGYSRLMEEDEAATLTTLVAHQAIIENAIIDHAGRLVGSAGDNFLAEFASTIDAVQCAIAFQAAIADANGRYREDRRMRFRVGINMSEVVVIGDDIFGDGVNIAARLQALAEPGGIYVSASVREQIGNKLTCRFEEVPGSRAKNIRNPLRAFRLRLA
jgi:class 3 adenylate cyclase